MKKLLITKKKMTPEEERIIERKLEEVDLILYKNTSAEELEDFEKVELSVDGGSVKIRTPLGKSSESKQYKAIKIHELGAGALYKEDEKLSSWVNKQPLAEKVTCLGDGHDGVWNVVTQIATTDQRTEILDWYHSHGKSL